ncbi:helix-turn-helix domain-containing protein [Psychromarinibacter sp. S121]|uniref:helix-turn-helix domain-containing protein n=1 Tax=Psychromarinibacter sp. S121 TaxID=3415127 RepID=UPI003C7E0793
MTVGAPAPSFYLYGDEQLDEDLDTIHVEPIRERSLRHDWIIHPHLHPDHVQILWIAEGGARFVIEGETYVASARSLVVQPAGALHEIRFEPGTEGRVVTAAVSYVEAVARDDPRLIAITRTPGVYSVPDDSPCGSTVPQHFNQILTEAHWDAPGRRTAIRGCFLNVLVSLLRVAENRSGAEPSRQDRDFELVTRYRAAIETHFRSQKSLAFYARNIGVSTQRLNAACRLRAGRTASEVLYDRIVVEAKRCLLYTEMTVAEIGHSIGYEDPAYFNRFFSKRVGTPPGTFRAEAATTTRVGG